MKKICLFGCKSTTIFLLQSLKQKFDISYVVTISPEDGKKHQVADYADLQTYCAAEKIKCHTADRYDLKNENDIAFFDAMKFDLAFVTGWQRLIPVDVLQTFSIGVFGMHGSTDDLPIGRGRSPMNWALIEQRKHFFTNIFKYDPGVDSGDILDTLSFSIQANDTAETMQYKNVLAMKTLILKNMDHLLSGQLFLKQQKALTPTYYPKRNPTDGLIDWGQDLFQIESLIRAVAKPFDGAYSYVEEKQCVIWRASVFETDLVDYGYRNNQFGEIVEVFPNGKFLVRCRGGLLIVYEYQFEEMITKGAVMISPQQEIKYFELNKYGYHDI